MRRKVLTVYGIVLLSLAFGVWLGTQEGTWVHPVRAQTSSNYLSSVPIPSTLKTTQVWMREPFCLRVWWYDDHGNPVRLCSEDKGLDTPSPGAPHKVDLPGPAALALVGKGERWELSAVAMARPDMLPGPNFVPVSGPTLVTILSQVTPSPTMPPPASVTPSPPFGATATPTARVTPTPTPSPPGGGTPTATVPLLLTPTACYPSLNIYGYDERVGPPNVPSVHYYVGSGCGALVVQLEGPAVITAYNRMLDTLLEENLRRLVQRCLAHPQECEQLLTPEAR